MANISKNNYGEYIIDGMITQDDINFFNRLETDSNICLKNTQGISSELLSRITNEKIKFSVIGGLERTKRKYDTSYYQDRTYHSKEELIKIIEYFESIEKSIVPEMTDMQKCMYIYSCLIQDTDYVTRHRDADVDFKLIENTLVGNLYHKLTCAGVALTFKELMDRQGIECDYLNKRNAHSFNRIKIDGKTYGIDLTWDLSHNQQASLDTFNYFGRQDTNRFYVGHHDLRNEPDETMNEVVTFTSEEIEKCFNSIKQLLDNREKHIPAVDQMSREEKIGILKYHHNYNELQREEMFINLIKYLRNKKVISDNDFRCNFANKRSPIVGDIVGTNITSLENVEGIDNNDYNPTKKENYDDLILQAIDKYLISYIKEFFETSAVYANTINYVSPDVDEELYIYYGNLKNKIEYFNSIRDKVIAMGYEEELSYFNFVLKREEEKRKQEMIDKYDEKSQYDYDYDYLFGIISPDEMLYIYNNIENSLGRNITIDEFKKFFTNPSYMRPMFNRKWNFTDEELFKLLNEVYNTKISTMIELMSQNKNIDINLTETNDSSYDTGFGGFENFETYEEDSENIKFL